MRLFNKVVKLSAEFIVGRTQFLTQRLQARNIVVEVVELGLVDACLVLQLRLVGLVIHGLLEQGNLNCQLSV